MQTTTILTKNSFIFITKALIEDLSVIIILSYKCVVFTVIHHEIISEYYSKNSIYITCLRRQAVNVE